MNSGYRGRLIFAFEVELRHLDTQATAAVDPDDGGPLIAGYDRQFREPVATPSGNTRQEMAPIRIPCQVEDETAEEMQQRPLGDDPTARTRFVFHYATLESLGLVDANGTAKIKVNDRATAIYLRSGGLVQRLDANGAGLYCISVVPGSFGLSGARRNLLVTTFSRRKMS